MPRYQLSRGALESATPGLSRLAAAVASSKGAYKDAYDKEQLNQAHLSQIAALAGQQQAHADQLNAETDILNNRPQVFDTTVAARSGSTVPQVQAVKQFMTTGVMPERQLPGPPTEEGITAGSAPVADQATASKVMTLIGQLAPTLLGNVKDNKADDLAKADQTYRNMGLSDQVINGTVDRNKVAGAQAAIEGKPLFHTDTNGAVLDQFGGNLDTSNPMAQSTIGLRGAQAGQAKASAAEHYAGVREKDATAGLRRAQTGAVGQGGGKAPAGYQWTTDPASGDPALQIIKGGPADPANKGAKSLNGEQANALTFAARMQAAQDELDQLAKKGVYRGSLLKQGAETVPLVGGALGMAANAFASPEQQQVEQAQRDFINAVLRRESGAAISMGEFSNAAKQYFDQPNDSPQVRAQKRTARQRVINGMLAAVPENLRTIPDASRQPSASPAAGGNRNISVDY
ncbi:MAG TPA: hypothetical protein VFM48_08230 [Aquabacterium sp.]|nr:hypothetical protein [Aquabacterium sp.]